MSSGKKRVITKNQKGSRMSKKQYDYNDTSEEMISKTISIEDISDKKGESIMSP
jgi:hypothetical protein